MTAVLGVGIFAFALMLLCFVSGLILGAHAGAADVAYYLRTLRHLEEENTRLHRSLRERTAAEYQATQGLLAARRAQEAALQLADFRRRGVLRVV